jgi:DNA adenine methylase
MFDLVNRAKPVLKWAGGKSQLLPQLLEHFPGRFDRLIEPFLGGGAVALALKPGVPAVLNDGNAELINLYQVIRSSPRELMNALDRLSALYSEDFYYKVRSEVPADLIEQAARTVFLNKTGFNGLYRQNSKGGFNVPFGKRELCPALYDVENLMAVSIRLKTAELQHGDFEGAIAAARRGDFVYCDPPYEPLSRTSSFNAYTGGGFSQSEQARLRAVCLEAARRGVTVAISNSAASFILDLYAQDDVRKVSAKRSINSKGNGRGEIDEVLVFFSPHCPETTVIKEARGYSFP